MRACTVRTFQAIKTDILFDSGLFRLKMIVKWIHQYLCANVNFIEKEEHREKKFYSVVVELGFGDVFYFTLTCCGLLYSYFHWR